MESERAASIGAVLVDFVGVQRPSLPESCSIAFTVPHLTSIRMGMLLQSSGAASLRVTVLSGRIVLEVPPPDSTSSCRSSLGTRGPKVRENQLNRCGVRCMQTRRSV